MKSKNIVGDNIKRLRLSSGFTQEELALSSGLSQGYINQLENGKRNFTQKSLERIACELHVDMYRLLMEGDIKSLTVLNSFTPPCAFKRDCDRYKGNDNLPSSEEFMSLLERLPKNVRERYYRLLVIEGDDFNR